MRSSPMPVSIEGRGSGWRSSFVTCSNCMKTRFQNSRKRSPSSSGLPGGPPQMCSPRSMKISEHGPHGPVSPIAQKLSEVGDADDAVVGEARDLLPEAGRLVVVVIDGDEQLVLLQPELLGDQVPGELDRALLEVVAEREIAEHLEEGEMARGVADIVEVVVLAAGAHAFLRGGGALIGPLLDAGEDVLELHHAGIGEHQGRVVARHQRRRRHDLVAVRPRSNSEMST